MDENNGNPVTSASAPVVAGVTREEFNSFSSEIRSIVETAVSTIERGLDNLNLRVSRLEGAEEPEGGSVSERVERLEYVAGKWNSADLAEFERNKRDAKRD